MLEDGGCFAHKMLGIGSRGITHYKVPKVETLPAYRVAEGKVTAGLVIELRTLGLILMHDNFLNARQRPLCDTSLRCQHKPEKLKQIT